MIAVYEDLFLISRKFFLFRCLMVNRRSEVRLSQEVNEDEVIEKVGQSEQAVKPGAGCD